MADRTEVTIVANMNDGRRVTATAMEQIGPEDCYNVLVRAVMHRYVTGEDVVPAIPREVKDAMIKQNLVI